MSVWFRKHKMITTALVLSALLIINIAFNAAYISIAKAKVPDYLKELTTEDYLEDYDMYWTTLEARYPLFPVVEREYGVDVEEIKARYRQRIASEDIDILGFYNLMNQMTYEMHTLGHLYIVTPQLYDMFKHTLLGYIDHLDEMGIPDYPFLTDNSSDDIYEWIDRLSQRYGFFIEDGNLKFRRVWGNVNSNNPKGAEFREINDDISVITMRSFDNSLINEDAESIKEWLFEHQDDKILVLDIRGNGGGNSMYWMTNIVQYLIDEPLTMSDYSLIKYVDEFWQERGASNDLSEITDLLNIIMEDIEGMSVYKSNNIIPPAQDKIEFDGEIYVIINGYTGSAASEFASWCKATGFATLIGTRCGSGAGGRTPLFGQMPNTKLAFMYCDTYGLNPDGSCNQVAGVEPDIYSESSPLNYSGKFFTDMLEEKEK